MDKVNQIIANVAASIQLILDYAINLCAQPFYFITAIIQGLVEIWSGEPEEQPDEKHNVSVYQSANEGKCGTEDDYDEDVSCDPYSKQIGYRINR